MRSFTGGLYDETKFQAGLAQRLRLGPRTSHVVPFSFRIPATAPNGSYTCAEVYFGQGRTNFFFDIVGYQEVLCIQKGETGALRVLDEKSSRELLREREISRRRVLTSTRRSR